MPNRAQPAKQFVELIVAEDECVAAAQKDIAYFGVLLEIAERFVEIRVQFLLADAADHPTARAISAVTSSAIRHEKENPIRISMDQTRHRHVRIFAAWVSHVVMRCPGLFDPWNDLTPDWIVWIVSRDEVEKVRRDGEGELVAGKQNPAAFLFAKIDILLELSERSNSIFELPFPIVPEFRCDLGPTARRMRDELFSVALFCRKSDHFELRKNVKVVNNRVNGGTEKCATNVLLRDGDNPANEFHSRGGWRFSQDTRPWSLDRDERADRNFREKLACRF